MSIQIRPEFMSHRLNDSGQCAMKELAEAFSGLLERVEQLVPPGRERSLVATKLQEASMFANRGISLDPRNSAG